MATFQELGRKLDNLGDKLAVRTEAGLDKAGGELKDWGKGLDELGGRIKKLAQEGVEKISDEARERVEIIKLRSEIKDNEHQVEKLTQRLGTRTYQLHLKNKVGNVELRKLGGRVTQLKKAIRAKEKEIARLKEQDQMREG